MSRNILRHLTAGTACLALAAGGSTAVASAGSGTEPREGMSAPSPAGTLHVERSLDALAKLLARGVTDRALRVQIHDEIAERSGGDTAVGYRSLSGVSDVRRELASAYGHGRSVTQADALGAIDRLAGDIPRFQVAVPANFEGWDPASVTPLVGYAPQGIDDTDVTTITAYDSTGGVHELDAQAEPSQPVIILGTAETVPEDDSAVADDSAIDDIQAPPLGRAVASSSCYGVRLSYVRLWKDMEPWWKGMAEIRLVAKGTGLWYHDEFPYLEMDGDFLYPDEPLGCTDSDVRFYWYENDSGDYDLGLKCCNGFSFGIQVADEDDLIGGRQVDKSHFKGTTDHTTDFGEVVMKTR